MAVTGSDVEGGPSILISNINRGLGDQKFNNFCMAVLGRGMEWAGDGRVYNWDEKRIQRFRAIMDDEGVRQKAQKHRADSYRMQGMGKAMDLQTLLSQFQAVARYNPEGIENSDELMKELRETIQRMTGMTQEELPELE